MKNLTGVRQDPSMPRSSMPPWNPRHLHRLRGEKDLTLVRLAVLAGLEYRRVKGYSTGRHAPSPGALVRMAKVLGVKTTDLAPLSPRPDLGEYRWHAGLQLDELAAKVNLHPDYVGEIVRGAGPITDPDRWAVALGISVEQVRAAWQESRRRLRGDNENTNDNNENNIQENGGR